MTLVLRSFAVWLGILVLASLNGALRDLVVAPRLGDTPARALSTVILCGLVLLVTWGSVGWIGPRSTRRNGHGAGELVLKSNKLSNQE